MRSISIVSTDPAKIPPFECRTTNIRVECKLSYLESKGMARLDNSSARVQNFLDGNSRSTILAVFSRLVCDLIPILDESTWK